MAIQIETDRVLLRHWIAEDLPIWIAQNSDPENLQYFPRVYSAEESTESFNRLKKTLEEDQFGLWAAVEKSSGQFMGFIGIAERNHEGIAFMPCREIGWRLDKKFWGKGYATEAARVVLEYGVHQLNLGEIVSYTAALNEPSINVMRKIGLRFRPDLAFEHPHIEVGNPLRTHVVYST